MDLNKKIALVTGSSKGIGSACATVLAENGCNVVINYNSSKKEAEDLKQKLETKYNINAIVIKCNISNEEEIKSMIDITIKTFGKIDILINNAAIVIDDNINDKTKEDFMKVLEVNVVGTFLVTKYASKHMNNGVIVNVSSTDAVDTYNELSIDYCASKAAVNSLTKTLSLAIKNNKVISVMPKWTKTQGVMEMNMEYLNSELKRTNQERLYEADEVALEIIELIKNYSVLSGEIIRLGEKE